MKVFVGVDQALRKIGVSVVQDGHVALMKRITPPSDLRSTPRMHYLREALAHALEPWPEADGTAMEGQSYGSDGQLDQLGRIGGIVEVLLMDLYGRPPLVIPPAVVKKFVAGNGQASKTMMMRATKVYWDVETDDDDLCDAHGLARFAAEYYDPHSTLRHQLEAVQVIRSPKPKPKRIKKIFPTTL